MIQLFTTPTCPQCQRLKSLFKDKGIDFDQFDLTTPAGLTELRTLDIWELQVPILVLDKGNPTKYLKAADIEALSDEALIGVANG